ncbi:MAG TPA: ATP-dependent RecD-like DNA helicase [Verrucomicrobiae bacterium]|jgi:ATP-dependent exoDNAse (exonuclease V) alpha subunit|nr:ATP-dependent RecD-like DNA helicase [Verrucomicrobiae bacterium]
MKINSFPLRHISIRVPWHDSGWNGTVCCQPKHNSACLKLKNISDSKDEVQEEKIAGQSISTMPWQEFPPCVKERGTFMAPFAFHRFHVHPYSKTSPDTHEHFAPTQLQYPAFAAAALPFRWLMRKELEETLTKQHPLGDLDLSREPELPFKTNWIQEKQNHLCTLGTFWNYVREEESLVFFYAKQVPFLEDNTRRILIGAGRVKKLGGLNEYAYNGSSAGKIQSMMWELMVTHSIRTDGSDGFLLPYHQLIVAAESNPEVDLSEFAVLAPSERFEEFSYATEHVTDDTAIAALAALQIGLRKAASILPDFDPRAAEKWIDQESGRLWRKRGPFPGLGAVLTAFGVHLGHFAAHTIQTKAGDDGDPWPLVDQMFQKPTSVLPAELAGNVDTTLGKTWQRLSTERRAYLQLLSRLNLTDEQANILYSELSRSDNGVQLTDVQILENPYLIYEATRLTLFPVAVAVVDRGVFPTPAIREKFPVPEPSRVTTNVDARRLRALVVAELEAAAAAGDTLRPRDAIIATFREGTEDEAATPVTEDLLGVAEDETFDGEIICVKMGDGRIAYQLDRFKLVGLKIRQAVDKRTGDKAQPLEVKVDWRQRLDDFLKPIPDDSDRETEENARQEKAAALVQLASSRFSVLIGPAGTGKTTLLSVLCAHPDVAEGNILLLAPTGKARVRMESIARRAGTQNFQAATLAQFLWKSGRYEGRTGRYRLQPDAEPDGGARTVIVDEASMLTEEMFAALLEGLTGVHRLILVGDTAQLPPIGAGRPFVDIVRKLQPDDIESKFPRVAPGYVELTIPRRQGAASREDLQLATWFAARAGGPGDDEIFDILTGRRTSPHLRLVEWNTAAELDVLLPQVLMEELKIPAGAEETKVFAQTLGGSEYNGNVYFHAGQLGPAESQLHGADRWQILTPTRQKAWGVDEINRLLHQRFRAQTLNHARQHPFKRKIPKPMGTQQIVYGDKVINNRNQRPKDDRIYDPQNVGVKYLANGEIGLVTGHLRSKKRNWVPKDLEVEFSTQPGVSYTFWGSDFAEEAEVKLELAYALTVHKAQGSEFGVVFLVLPRGTRLLNREMLYTSLTRQREKVIVLHQGPATELQKLSHWQFSSAAQRLTNLFVAPKPRQIGGKGGRFLEERLIHLTLRGDLVRSKSELIVADNLHREGIRYTYERPLTLDGALKYPDFTIDDEDSGITYYWEHCGMLSDAKYRERWAAKQQWYRDHQILPYQEGGGKKGTLIVTEDTRQGAISSQEILGIIRKVLLSQS